MLLDFYVVMLTYMKKQIIAIGGGTFKPFYSPQPIIEKYILALSDKKHPKICFLSQASAEDEGYIISFYDLFLQLGSQPSKLSLFGRVEPTSIDHLLSQDIIFVGGGNTKSMLALWCAWGVDNVLKQAYEKGIILAGVSAGAICWFQQGITDSVWPMGVLECMGILKGSCCPHYDSEPERRPIFTQSVNAGEALSGIALSDYTAVHYVDGVLTYSLSWKSEKKVYAVSKNEEKELSTVAINELG